MTSFLSCSSASLVLPCRTVLKKCYATLGGGILLDRLACTGRGCHLFCILLLIVDACQPAHSRDRKSVQTTHRSALDLWSRVGTNQKDIIKDGEAFQNLVLDHLLLRFLLQGSCIFKKGSRFWAWLVGQIYDTEVLILQSEWRNQKQSKIDVEKFRT